MSQWQGIGVMSGTSLDGLDVAHCTFILDDDAQWSGRIEVAETLALPPRWVRMLRHLPQASAMEYAAAHAELGHFIGREVADFIHRHGIHPQWVASHGQTIFHQPEAGFTAQIGDGEVMATHLEVPVVSHFRAKDVALGGQGAPLVPFGEQHLFRQYAYCLNLGGFANVSHGGLAYDVCPCNLPMNLLATEAALPDGFDRDGAAARSGSLLPQLASAWEALPYYQRTGPRSLGTEWLNAEFLPLLAQSPGSAQDKLHTLCHHIAGRVAQAVGHHAQGGELLLTGGGAHNAFLRELLAERLAPHQVTLAPVDRLMVDFKEAYIFSFLGLMTLLGKTNTLSTVTGAAKESCAGSIHLPPGGGYRLWQ